MSSPQPTGSLGDELTNLGIGLLIATAVLAAILRTAGSITAWMPWVAPNASSPTAMK